MSDIVGRLRYTAQIRSQHRSDTDPIKLECIEAADEITALRTEVERLRAALEDIIADSFSIYAIQVARAALEAPQGRISEASAQPAPDVIARNGEQRTICEDCGNSNLAHDRAVWTDDGASYCPTCRAALAAQPAPSPWRPIETAPKDGTEVLMVFVFEDGEVLHRVVRWDASEMWPWRDEYTGYREREAKGWMPLPIPPPQEPRT